MGNFIGGIIRYWRRALFAASAATTTTVHIVLIERNNALIDRTERGTTKRKLNFLQIFSSSFHQFKALVSVCRSSHVRMHRGFYCYIELGTLKQVLSII